VDLAFVGQEQPAAGEDALLLVDLRLDKGAAADGPFSASTRPLKSLITNQSSAIAWAVLELRRASRCILPEALARLEFGRFTAFAALPLGSRRAAANRAWRQRGAITARTHSWHCRV
jgi:hypothetical protein